MNWIDIITTALASSSIVAITLVILGFIARNLFSQILAKDIENHKTQLGFEGEKFRASLEITAMEHRIRFESLHIKRAVVIEHVYKLLIKAEKEASALITCFAKKSEQSEKEKFELACKSADKLNAYFSENEIYFEEDLCKRIETFINRLHAVLYQFKLVLDNLDEYRKDEESLDEWKEAWREIKEDLDPIKIEIKQKFRSLIGID